MNKNNKILCTVIALTMILSSFAGCGSKDENPVNTATFDTVSIVKEEVTDSQAESSSAAESKSEKSEKTILYVTGAESVPFSAEGSENYEPTGELAKGTKLETEQEDLSAEYVLVYNPKDKISGYVKSIYLVADESQVAEGEILVVNEDNINLYVKSDGDKNNVIRTLAKGEEVSALAKVSGDYWKVITVSGGEVGFVNILSVIGSDKNDVESIASKGSGSKADKTASNTSSGNSSNSGTQVYTTENILVGGDNTGTTTYYRGTSRTSSAADSSGTVNPSTPGNVHSDEPTDNPTQTIENNTDFSSVVAKARNNVGGNWAAALVDLSSGDEITADNDSQMQAASLIKLFIMGAIYEKYDTYKEQDSNVDSYLYSMITVSDNTAANNLVRILGSGNTDAGKNVVTSYCKTHGYNNSSMGRLLLESTINGDNYTSVGDCARFLTRVYRGELEHSDDMLNLLKQQTRTSKIPSGVPSGVQTANKTGELDLVQNDAAIVFADRPYVLCVMSENVPAGSAVSAIVTLSSEIYNMVNS